MMRLRSGLPAVCLLFVFSAFALGQEPAKAATEEAPEAEAQALEILDSIAESIPALRSPDNRIYLSATVADLLWEKDEKRARSLFDTLTREVGNLLATLDPNDQRSLNTLGVIQEQRREIVERLARRDPEMALSFVQATRPPAGLTTGINDNLSEANVELYLAGLLAGKNPEKALQMARAALSRGVNYSLVSLLLQISSKDPEGARALHSEIVDKLKTTPMLASYDSVNVSMSLLNSFQPPQANEDTYRSLIDLISSSVLSAKPDVRANMVQNLANQLPGVMQQIEKYAPARVATLKQWSQQVKRTQDAGSRIYQELNEVSHKGTVEDILALTSKYGPEYHPQIYQYAANKAVAGGDANRARQIIKDFVPEGPQRLQMLEQLHNQMFWNAVNENRIADAHQALAGVRSPDQRFQLLVAMATNVMSRGQQKQASSILDEAAILLDSQPANSWKLTAQLQLAQCYSTSNTSQSVALLQSVILLANQLVSAAVVLDGFENTYLKDGEWTKRGYTNLGNLVTTIEQNLGALARVDAANARSLSNQLERPEIRLMAQLEIAKALLNPSANHSNFHQVFSTLPKRSR